MKMAVGQNMFIYILFDIQILFILPTIHSTYDGILNGFKPIGDSRAV